jgi:hypothetical protein
LREIAEGAAAEPGCPPRDHRDQPALLLQSGGQGPSIPPPPFSDRGSSLLGGGHRGRSLIVAAAELVAATYLFVRFGLIATVFSNARFNAEALAEKLLAVRPLPPGIDGSYIYKTNSYFEWAHEEFRLPTLLFLLTIPIAFALNHALTLYMLFKLPVSGTIFGLLALIYASIVGFCYVGYYKMNKGNTPVFKGPGNLFIVLTVCAALAATAAILIFLPNLDRGPAKVQF